MGVSGTFVRAEELSVRVGLGGHNHETWAYHIFPSARLVNRLVIMHHGHGDSFQSGNPDYRLNETLARFLGSGYAVLAMYTPNYGPAPTADVSKTELANDDRHNPIFAQHRHSPATLRVFLEPVAACLNYFTPANSHAVRPCMDTPWKSPPAPIRRPLRRDGL